MSIEHTETAAPDYGPPAVQTSIAALDGRRVEADTDSWVTIVAQVAKLAAHICDTEFVPKGLRNSAPATTAAILYGREVGLPPMTALSQTSVIEGKPAMSAEAMRALILAAGHDLVFDETNGARCVIRGRRRGSDQWTTVTWTIDMARAAKIAHRDNWVNYPRRMLQARATTELAQMVFPDVIHGFAVIEEAEDLRAARSDGTTAAPSGKVTRAGGRRPTRPAAEAPTGQARPETGQPTLPESIPLPGEAGYPGDQPTGEQPTSTPSGPSSGRTPGPEGAPTGEPDWATEPITTGQRASLFAAFKRLGITDRQDQLDVIAAITGRPVGSRAHLRKTEASTLIDTLGRCRTREDLDAILTTATRLATEADAEAEEEALAAAEDARTIADAQATENTDDQPPPEEDT